MNRARCLALGAVALLLLSPNIRAEDNRTYEEEILQTAGWATNSASLLRRLEQHVPPDRDPNPSPELIRLLGDRQYAQRTRAREQLIAAGVAALPLLRDATKNTDPEIAQSARVALAEIDKRLDPIEVGNVQAAVHILGERGYTDAIPCLLGLLRVPVDADLTEEIWYALDALVRKAGRVDAKWLAVPTQRFPEQRAAAGFLAARYGDKPQRNAVRALLIDSEEVVRLRVAQGLMGAGDPSVLPTLIELLDTPHTTYAWQAEELLRWVAGPRTPKKMVGDGTPSNRPAADPRVYVPPAEEELVGDGTPENRRACRDAWRRWWNEEGACVDLRAVLSGKRKPRLVLAHTGFHMRLMGSDGQVRWNLKVFPKQTFHPSEFVATDRFVVCRNKPMEVVDELGFDGGLKRRTVSSGCASPEYAHRLPNGTLVAVSYGVYQLAILAPDRVRAKSITPQIDTTKDMIRRQYRCVFAGIRYGRIVKHEVVSLDNDADVLNRDRANPKNFPEYPAHQWWIDINPLTGEKMRIQESEALPYGWNCRVQGGDLLAIRCDDWQTRTGIEIDCRNRMRMICQNNCDQLFRLHDGRYLCSYHSRPSERDNLGRVVVTDHVGSALPDRSRPVLQVIRLGFGVLE